MYRYYLTVRDNLTCVTKILKSYLHNMWLKQTTMSFSSHTLALQSADFCFCAEKRKMVTLSITLVVEIWTLLLALLHKRTRVRW